MGYLDRTAVSRIARAPAGFSATHAENPGADAVEGPIVLSYDIAPRRGRASSHATALRVKITRSAETTLAMPSDAGGYRLERHFDLHLPAQKLDQQDHALLFDLAFEQAGPVG